MTAAPTSKYAITFVFITVLLDMVGFGLIMPVLPALIQDVGKLDIGHASLIGGWLFAAFSVTQFLFGPTMGNLSDAYGRRPLLLLAVAGLGVDYLIMALAPNIAWLFVGRLFAGFCGASYVVANAFIADITAPEDRAKAFGMMGAAFGLGFVIGPAIGGLLGTFGPRVPFYAAAAVSVLNLIFGYFILPETLAAAQRRKFEWARANPIGTFKVFGTYKGVMPLCVVMAIYFFASAIYPAIWPFWGAAKFHWSAATIGLTLAGFGIIMAIVQGGLTGLALKYASEWTLALVGMIVGVLMLIGYGLAGSFTVVMILLVIHGAEGFVHPMLTSMMSREVPPDAQGEMQGGMAGIQSLAMLIGTVFFSQIFGYFLLPAAPFISTDIAFYAAAVFMALSLVMFLIYAKKPDEVRREP
jgi:MFS transporter, DHA1 family, tetracycline resistance protein